MSKKIIYGDTVGTPAGRPDWAEKNERSASYIRNKPLAIVDEYNALNSLNDNFLLGFVKTNRVGFTPVTLEVGVKYGGPECDKGTLYVDPLLLNFFPCEAFTIITEQVTTAVHATTYENYEITTDGSTYILFKSLHDGDFGFVLFFNNSTTPIVIDNITFPVGWSFYNPRHNDEPEEFTDYFANRILLHLTCLKFGTDEHFADLEKILGTTDVYSYVKGFYQYGTYGWERVDGGDIKIELNAVSEKAHTHTISDDSNGNVTIKLSANSDGGLDFDGDLDIGGGGDLDLGGDIVLQSIGQEDTKEMKTLTLDNSTYKIVDSEARERLNVVYDYLNPSWDTTLVFDGGDADVQVAVLDETILL